MIFGEALSVIEIKLVARGYWILNQALMSASVQVLDAYGLASGHFLILLNGTFTETKRAHDYVCDHHRADMVDAALFQKIHPQVLPAMYAQAGPTVQDAIGVFEADTISALIRGAHAACELGGASLIDIRIGQGNHSHPFFFITGTDAGVTGAMARASDAGPGSSEVIMKPHPMFLRFFSLQG